MLLSELFLKQSSRWSDIASEHVEKIYGEIEDFLEAATRHLITDEQVRDDVLEIAISAMKMQKTKAAKELKHLYEDEKQQPLTYNHYYTDNVQKSRQDATRKIIRKAMDNAREQDFNGKLHISNIHVDAERLMASLQNHVIVDMDAQACGEALSGLKAYYKVR